MKCKRVVEQGFFKISVTHHTGVLVFFLSKKKREKKQREKINDNVLRTIC